MWLPFLVCLAGGFFRRRRVDCKVNWDFAIIPQIDPGTLLKTKTNFSFARSAPANGSYRVE